LDSTSQKHSGENVTDLLVDWSNGNQSAFERLVPYVMPELRQLAGYYMRGERAGHMLQTTALVNEAWLRLIDQRRGTWESRVHFFAAAARIMRQILVDYARRRHSAKRGGDAAASAFDNALAIPDERSEYFLLLDQALQKLAQTDPRKSRVVELRFFGGMTVEETAQVIGVSANTVIGDWRLAKAWLRQEIGSV
jgi:RNA polymerase sigma factor (TIGR02999 family)